MGNNDINSSGINESLFEAKIDMPDTSELKSRIMKLTATMPQKVSDGKHDVTVENNCPEQKKAFFGEIFKPKFIAQFAVAASLVLVAVLWVPSNFQQTGTNPHLLSEAKTVNSSEADLAEGAAYFTVNDELDFQETMLFVDEQMFVQL